MKTKWIIVTRLKTNKTYHCWDDLYDSKKEALEIIADRMKMRIPNELWDWKKTKIFPINWSSLENRSINFAEREMKKEQRKYAKIYDLSNVPKPPDRILREGDQPRKPRD